MLRSTTQLSLFVGIIAVPTLLFAQPPGRGRPQGGMQGGGMRGGPPTQMIVQIFTQADSNKDGSVSREELNAAMESMQRGGQQGRGDQHGRGGPERGGQFGQRPGGGPGGPGRPGGPPPHEQGDGEHAHGEHGHGGRGGPPQPGQVLPEMIAQQLNLTEIQSQQLAALQTDVDKRLAGILTDEQHEQMKNARPRQGRPEHGQGGQGRGGQRGGGRPE